ncbi:hypothetical protein FF38_06410 [Lucilia cuprina]|uniref:Uncharacterized protein n=1 Tax=Lucilia cuprina TaxID=7375 RepID=A0A0L0BSK3_LUCCU|nr:hypothetical protein FF38_06410 [Lucilia cuprina]
MIFTVLFITGALITTPSKVLFRPSRQSIGYDDCVQFKFNWQLEILLRSLMLCRVVDYCIQESSLMRQFQYYERILKTWQNVNFSKDDYNDVDDNDKEDCDGDVVVILSPNATEDDFNDNGRAVTNSLEKDTKKPNTTALSATTRSAKLQSDSERILALYEQRLRPKILTAPRGSKTLKE